MSTLGGLIPCVLAIFSCFPMLRSGFPEGHDWIFELVRVAEYSRALESGQVMPYWAEELYWGFGSPIFIYYAPLFAVLASSFSSFFGSVTSGSVAALLLASLLSAYAVYGTLRELLPRNQVWAGAAARVAAAVYLFSPYLLGDKLIRNANAEFTALAIFPFVLWGLLRIRNGRMSGYPLLAFALTACIFAHNLTALIALTTVLLLSIFLFLNRWQWAVFWHIQLWTVLGVLLAAVFWLPVLTLKSLVRTEEMLLGKFDFHSNFQSFMSFFSYQEVVGVGVVPLLILLVSLLILSGVLCCSREHRQLMIIFCVSALSLLALQAQFSTPVWETLPFFPLFQFPWRLMGPLALVLAVLAGLVFFILLDGRSRRAVVMAEVVFTIAIMVNAIPVMQRYLPLADNAARLSAELSASGLIRERGLPATVLDEYLPKNAMINVAKNAPINRAELWSAQSVSFRTVEATGTRLQFAIEAKTASVVNVARWYIPGWQARLNGAEQVVTRSGWGGLQINLPAGQHVLEVFLPQPRERWIGLLISLVSLGCLLALLIMRWRGMRAARVAAKTVQEWS